MTHDMRRLISLAEATKPPRQKTQQPFDITQTPAFKAWFADSKVVDANGKPLRVYHGTYGDFTEFSHEHAAGRGNLLAFFSASPKMASDYANTSHEMDGQPSPGAKVIPVYLRIRKPFDYRQHYFVVDNFWNQTGGIQDQFDLQKIRMGLGLQEYIDDTKRYRLSKAQFMKAIKAGAWDALEAEEFVDWLRSRGCDGIITAENGVDNYGVFKANQIKSAIGNREFSTGSGDITETQ